MKTFRILTHFIESQNSEQNFDVIESWYFDVFDKLILCNVQCFK